MDEIIYYELKDIYGKYNENSLEEKDKEKIAWYIDTLICYSEIARNEGVPAIEADIYDLDENDKCQRFLKKLLEMMTDGYDKTLIREIGLALYVTDIPDVMDALIHLICIKGVLFIQQEANPLITEEMLYAMIPTDIREDIHTLVEKRKKIHDDEQDRKNHCILEQLVAEDGKIIDKNDHSLLNQLSIVIIHSEDRSIQRLLREIEYFDLGLVMHEMTGKVRKKIFQNMGDKVAGLVAYDIVHFTDNDLTEDNISDACVKILRAYIELCDTGQVNAYDEKNVKKLLGEYGEGG